MHQTDIQKIIDEAQSKADISSLLPDARAAADRFDKKASPSYLMRSLKVRYKTAAVLCDILKGEGYNIYPYND